MAVAFTQKERPIAVTTPLSRELLLEKFTGTEAVSQLFHFELNLLAELKDDSDKGIAFGELLGQSVTVEIRPTNLTKRHFNGIVSKLSEGHRAISPSGTKFLQYHAEVVPKLWLLKQRQDCRIFQQMKVKDIVNAVLSGAGLSEGDDYKFSLQGTYVSRDYCIQYRESDFDFVCRLLEDEGIFYFFQHADAKHTMIMADNKSSYLQTLGPATIAFEEFVAGVRDDERVTRWEKSQEIRTNKVTVRDYYFQKPDVLLEGSQPGGAITIGTIKHATSVTGNAGAEIYDFPGCFAQETDTDAGAAKIRLEEQAVSGVIVDGASDCRLLTPGHKFTLESHFNANGDYVVTRVDHESSVEGTYTQEAPTAHVYSNRFQCIPVSLAFRPPRVTPKPRIEGTQTAVVVGPSGEEIYTDEFGRVKVQFHWDRVGKKDDKSSCWIRVATLWTGATWGMVHIPRLGQEVIIAFEEGDLDHPIVIGCVFNPNNPPPYKLPDNKTQSGILTRSSLKGEAGNELRYEDKKDAEDIYFHAQKDFHRVVENDDDLKVKRDQTIEIKNNRTETVKEGNESVTIEKGNRTETIKEGDESITIEKGSRTHKVKKDESLTIEGKQTIEITGDRSLTVKQGNETIEISAGNRSTTIKTGNDTTKVSAGASSTEAMQSITLKVGGNSITIDQSGITIKGIAVTIQGQASIDAKAPMTSVKGDGTVIVKGGVTMIN